MEVTWNYRIIVRQDDDEEDFSIYEVYYEDDKIVAWTQDRVGISGNSIEELREAYKKFGRAFDKPILRPSFVNGKEILNE